MQVNVAKELAALEAMTVNELRAKYAQVFGEETRVGNKAWLDLSERDRRTRESGVTHGFDLPVRVNPHCH